MATTMLNLKRKVATDADLGREVQIASANGAIEIKTSTVVITKGTAAAMTLGIPTSDQNGVRIAIVSATAAAHTVTAATIGFNAADASGDVATFTSGIGNGFVVIAYEGEWLTESVRNVAFA